MILRLAEEFREAFDLEAVRWEAEPLFADAHFPSQITPPRETGLVAISLA